MRFLHKGKDGGGESTVWGFWLVEIKSMFSVVLLCFEDGSREAYHSHAFNCFSWVLRGCLTEVHLSPSTPVEKHRASWLPFITRRSTFHRVSSVGRTWVLSFRGPWAATWHEWVPGRGARASELVTLTNGRREV